VSNLLWPVRALSLSLSDETIHREFGIHFHVHAHAHLYDSLHPEEPRKPNSAERSREADNLDAHEDLRIDQQRLFHHTVQTLCEAIKQIILAANSTTRTSPALPSSRRASLENSIQRTSSLSVCSRQADETTMMTGACFFLFRSELAHESCQVVRDRLSEIDRH